MEMLPKARLMEAWRFKDKKPAETFLNRPFKFNGKW